MGSGTRALEWSGKATVLAFLLFFYFLVSDLLDSSPPAGRLTLVLVLVALFVGVYLSLMLGPATPLETQAGLLRLGSLFALALALALDPDASWSPAFIYVAAACGFRLRPRAAVPAIVVCAVLADVTEGAAQYGDGDTVQQALWALGIGLVTLSWSRMLQTNSELRAAREEIARLAVTEERLRFARDLHDLLGHSLSVIALKSELAGRLLGREPARAAAEVADIEQVTREALQEVRQAVTGYRRMTLVEELAGARAALSAAGIEAVVEHDEVALPEEAESVLAWAVREGTTNVIRHSGAVRCEIRVHAGLAGADIEVVDDGRGSRGRSRGVGLLGLAERARRLSGRVEAGVRPEGGYRLHVSVPTS